MSNARIHLFAILLVTTRERVTIPVVKIRISIASLLIALGGFVPASLDAGTIPNQSANLDNVTGTCNSPDTPTSNPSAGSCKVSYEITSWFFNCFTATVKIQNQGTTPVKNWAVQWNYSGNQCISNTWNGYALQSGKLVRVACADCNNSIPAGGTVSFNLMACYSGSNLTPTVFTVQ